MLKTKPWAKGPFELIHHAEGHFKNKNSGFDLRMALISYDNAIEQSITTFLGLSPIQRKNQSFKKEDVKKWKSNYFTILEFLEYYVVDTLKIDMKFGRDVILYFHKLRNELYHNGNGFVPDVDHVEKIREVALWVFSILFETKTEDLISILANASNYSVEDVDTSEFSNSTEFLEQSIELENIVDTLYSSLVDEKMEETDLMTKIEALKKVTNNKVLDEYEEAIEKSNEVRKSILDGETFDDDPSIERLNKEIKDMTDYFEFEFRSHQIKAADLALEKTLTSIFSQQNRRIGHVYQTLGSGRDYTLLLYLGKLILQKELESWKFLIVSDRSVVLDQINHLISREANFPLEVENIKNDQQLRNVLNGPGRKALLVTKQRLLRRKGSPSFSTSQVLIITTNVNSGFKALEETFINGYFIHFTSFPSSHFHEESLGEIISTFDLKTAVSEEIVVPILFEKRSFHPFQEKLLTPESEELFFSKRNSYELLKLIANDIVTHFEERQKVQNGKALIIVQDIESGERLKEEFFKQRPDWQRRGVVDFLSSKTSPVRQPSIIQKFKSDRDPLSIIITVNLWMGMDNPIIDTLYLLRNLKGHILSQAIANVNKRYPGKENGLVVDYFDNQMELQTV